MDSQLLIKNVDPERLYTHVMNLEGVKHPLDAPQNLAKAAAYISAELYRVSASVQLQPFHVEGFEDIFYNIEGWVGDETKPAGVVINHYDNVYQDPGASDNAAAIAVMLEIARIICTLPDPPHIRFVSVSLEEGNPLFEQKKRESLQRLQLTDAQQRPTSYLTARLLAGLGQSIQDSVWSGKSYGEGISSFTQQNQAQLTPAMLEYLKDLRNIVGRFDSTSSLGIVNRIGSSVWLHERLRKNKKIAFAICHDEIGITSRLPNSQRFPPELSVEHLKTYHTNLGKRVGDFVMLITEMNAEKLGAVFCEQCRLEEIELPYAWLELPVGGKQTIREFPQALGSDHAPFWAAGIPALFITDTAYLRNPFTHTPADTIDRIDFDHVAQICQATLSTILQVSVQL